MTTLQIANGLTVTVPEAASVSTEPVPVIKTKITKRAFKSRLTQTERIAIRAAASVNPVVFDFQDLLDSSVYVDLKDENTTSGLLALEQAGLLSLGRAEQILETPVDPSEEI